MVLSNQHALAERKQSHYDLGGKNKICLSRVKFKRLPLGVPVVAQLNEPD